jgi:hypothetical protein
MTWKRQPPDRAKYEADLGSRVALLDVSHLLPTHETKRWSARDTSKIIRCYVHHSGADGADGYAGMAGSARYSSTATKDKPAWAGFAYTYWHADVPDLLPDGRLVVYRGNPDHLRTFHTGGPANRHGVAQCFQGDRSKKPPSPEQVECFDALSGWLRERHALADADPFCPHSGSKRYGGSGKSTCPGPFIEALLAPGAL